MKQNDIIKFKEAEYDSKLKELNIQLPLVIEALKLSEIITADNYRTIDLEVVDNYLMESTGYKSPKLISGLIGVDTQYDIFTQIIETITPNVEYFDLKTDKPSLSKKALEALKESLTTRLSDEQQKFYDHLKKVAEFLNESFGTSPQMLDILIKSQTQFGVNISNAVVGFNRAKMMGINLDNILK